MPVQYSDCGWANGWPLRRRVVLTGSILEKIDVKASYQDEDAYGMERDKCVQTIPP